VVFLVTVITTANTPLDICDLSPYCHTLTSTNTSVIHPEGPL
jgi:hypothetical protein